MIRAALEGVLYNLYTVYLALIEVIERNTKHNQSNRRIC